MTTADLHWAAGFLEGEGSFNHFSTSPRVECAQGSDEPVEKMQRLFGGKIHKRWPGKSRGWQEQNLWYLYGGKAVGVMLTLYPILSSRRQAQIRGVLLKWHSAPWRKKKSV